MSPSYLCLVFTKQFVVEDPLINNSVFDNIYDAYIFLYKEANDFTVCYLFKIDCIFPNNYEFLGVNLSDSHDISENYSLFWNENLIKKLGVMMYVEDFDSVKVQIIERYYKRYKFRLNRYEYRLAKLNAQKALISFYFKNSKLLCLDVFEIILEKLELE